jgi:hypothetical protein
MKNRKTAIALLALAATAGLTVVAPTAATADTCAPLGQHTPYHAWTYESTPGGSGGCYKVFVQAHVHYTGGTYWGEVHWGYDIASVYDQYIFEALHWGI